MVQKLPERLQDIQSTLLDEINSVTKDFHAEKISAEEKNESIKTSADIAQYRTVNSIKSTFNGILINLQEERIDVKVFNRIKELFNEHL
jgi:hypothetical protein